MKVLFGFVMALLLVLPVGGVRAQTMLFEAVPSKAWRCDVTAPGSSGRTATLYFFDTPIVVDRYSSEQGLDRVDDINAAIAVVGSDGTFTEYTFGRFDADYQAYKISMRFSIFPTPDGLRLRNFPQPAMVTLIDRITGEMRASDAEPGSAPILCETVTGTFQNLVKAYYRLLASALNADKQASGR